ncbi:toprim domain-containing protein, partial [Proteus mirabilis]
LGVSEGIETALAVTRATGQTCWSVVNATLLARFEPPSNVKMLYIWADHDLSETGLNAANELKKKAWQKGILTQVLIPPIPTSLGVKSWDWNDVLNVYGAMGFTKVHI